MTYLYNKASRRNKSRNIILLWLLILSWLAILFFESTQPPAQFLGLIPHFDKIAHFAAFSILGLLMCCLTLKLKPKCRIPIFSTPLLVGTLCGAVEEFLQMLAPGRTASILDLLVDILAVIFTIILVNFSKRMWELRLLP